MVHYVHYEETEEKVLTAIYEVIEDVMKDVLGAK